MLSEIVARSFGRRLVDRNGPRDRDRDVREHVPLQRAASGERHRRRGAARERAERAGEARLVAGHRQSAARGSDGVELERRVAGERRVEGQAVDSESVALLVSVSVQVAGALTGRGAGAALARDRRDPRGPRAAR